MILLEGTQVVEKSVFPGLVENTPMQTHRNSFYFWNIFIFNLFSASIFVFRIFLA